MKQSRNNPIKELVLMIALISSLMLGSLAAWGGGSGGGDAPGDPRATVTPTPTPSPTPVGLILIDSAAA